LVDPGRAEAEAVDEGLVEGELGSPEELGVWSSLIDRDELMDWSDVSVARMHTG